MDGGVNPPNVRCGSRSPCSGRAFRRQLMRGRNSDGSKHRRRRLIGPSAPCSRLPASAPAPPSRPRSPQSARPVECDARTRTARRHPGRRDRSGRLTRGSGRRHEAGPRSAFLACASRTTFPGVRSTVAHAQSDIAVRVAEGARNGAVSNGNGTFEDARYRTRPHRRQRRLSDASEARSRSPIGRTVPDTRPCVRDWRFGGLDHRSDGPAVGRGLAWPLSVDVRRPGCPPCRTQRQVEISWGRRTRKFRRCRRSLLVVSQAELRVLRYLPMALTLNEIADELFGTRSGRRPRRSTASLVLTSRRRAVELGRAAGCSVITSPRSRGSAVTCLRATGRIR
jgi:hypothetical protein